MQCRTAFAPGTTLRGAAECGHEIALRSAARRHLHDHLVPHLYLCCLTTESADGVAEGSLSQPEPSGGEHVR